MMLEDLGLPNLEKKEVAELEVDFGFLFQRTKIDGWRFWRSGDVA